MRRVKTRLMGVSKKLAFSRKKGRFSGKNTSKRWFTVFCGWSDSTWLNSGFTVRSNTSLSRRTNLASSPRSPLDAFSKNGADGSR